MGPTTNYVKLAIVDGHKNNLEIVFCNSDEISAFMISTFDSKSCAKKTTELTVAVLLFDAEILKSKFHDF